MKLDEIVAKIKQIKPEEMTTRELVAWRNQMHSNYTHTMRTADELSRYNLSGTPTKQVEICDEVHGAMLTIFGCLQDQARCYIEALRDLDYEIVRRLEATEK